MTGLCRLPLTRSPNLASEDFSCPPLGSFAEPETEAPLEIRSFAHDRYRATIARARLALSSGGANQSSRATHTNTDANANTSTQLGCELTGWLAGWRANLLLSLSLAVVLVIWLRQSDGLGPADEIARRRAELSCT